MNQLVLKTNFWRCLFKFVKTRLLIIVIGALCFSIFPQRGEVYQQRAKQEVVSLKAVWDKFDSYWYQKLAAEGYPKRRFTDDRQETWGYMPLYSVLINFVTAISGLTTFFSGILISNICTLAALLLIYRLAQDKFNTGLQTVNLLLICSGSFYLSIVYSEGLFLLLTALVFYLTHRQKYGWALIIAGLSAVTRIQGCLLFVLPVVEIFFYKFRLSYRYIPVLILSTLPMVSLMYFLDQTCGEPLAFLKIQNAWGSSDLVPLQGFLAFLKGRNLSTMLVNGAFWVLTISIVFYNRQSMPLSYLIFTVLYFLLSTSNEIIYGTTRYMLGILPLFMAASISPNPVKRFFVTINLIFLAITISTFVTSVANFI